MKAGVAHVVLGAALISAPAFAQSTGAADDADTASSAPEIVVTGSRITNPNLSSITPVTVVTSQEFKDQGTVRVEDLLNSLPQVFASEGSTDANGASGIATVDLRSLGTARTLVLINGRRLGSGDPTDNVADLNFIPGSLIQNVEVLTGGASATYGSDALAGVVNFRLNTNFEGFQLDAQTSFYNHDNGFVDKNINDSGLFTRSCLGQPAYNCQLAARNYVPPRGNTADGAIQTITATFGAGFDDGRGHLTAYAGYRRVNAVTQGDRDFSYCAYSAGTTSGSNYYTCGGSSTSATGRFRRTVNSSLTATPVYRPTGTSYTTNPATPGTFRTYSSTRDGFNYNPYNYFQRPDERYTFGAFANYDISDAVKPYLEVMFMDDHTRAQIAPSGAFYGTDFFINCNNPLLSSSQQTSLCGANAGTPTIQSLYIGRRNIEGGPRTDDLRHTDYRVVLGVKGDINSAISYDIYGQFYRAILVERYENDFSRVKINRALNVVANPAGGAPVCASAIPDSTGRVIDASCKPWDIFTGAGPSQASINYLQTPGLQQGSSTEYVVSGAVNVDFGHYGVQLPWASSGVQAAFGAEYRRESIELLHDIEFLTGDLAGQGTPFGVPDVHGTYNVKEVFGELSVPIVSDKPGFETLGFTAGYRYSDYSLSGGTDTYKFGLEYAPIKQVRFRAGYNRAVRAPNPLELFNPATVGLFGRPNGDPCGGVAPTYTQAQCALTGVSAADYGTIDNNPANQYNQRRSGNTSLRPEKSDTFTVGVVLNPIRNLSLTVDYYNIKIVDAIGSLGANLIIDQCLTTADPFFCSRINRSAGGSLWTGNAYVDNPTLNLGSIKTSGIDVNADYRIDLGKRNTLSFNLVGTYLDNYSIRPIAGPQDIGDYNCAGLFGARRCGIPLNKWRHKLRATFQTGSGLGLTAAWRFFSAVNNEGTSPNPLLNAQTNPAVLHIPTVSYFDLGGSVRIGSNYTFRIGVQNLLDKDPPVLDTNYSNNGSNTYAQVYDSLGRYVYAAIQLNF